MDLAHIFNHLPKDSRPKFRILVSESCGWSYGTFYYKLKHGNFSKLELQVIEPIVKAFLLTNKLTDKPTE